MKVRFSLIMAIIGIVLASCGDDNDSEKWLTGKSQNFFYKQQSPQGDLAGVEGS